MDKKKILELVENTKKALYEGLNVIKSGITLNEVCKTIEKNKLFAKNTQNTVFCDFNFKNFSI